MYYFRNGTVWPGGAVALYPNVSFLHSLLYVVTLAVPVPPSCCLGQLCFSHVVPLE